MTIPAGIPPGLKTINAIGITSLGAGVVAVPATIDVEPTSPPTSISILDTALNFDYAGEQLPIGILGTFSEGSTTDLTKSTLVKWATNNSSVAAVSANGMVTATGPGVAKVTASIGTTAVSIQVNVPKSIRGDLNGDGQVDAHDLDVIIAYLNTPASGPFDARDLNGDGVISGLDARILVTLCTFPGCAFQ